MLKASCYNRHCNRDPAVNDVWKLIMTIRSLNALCVPEHRMDNPNNLWRYCRSLGRGYRILYNHIYQSRHQYIRLLHDRTERFELLRIDN